jgi:hypothetical protein
MISTRRYYAGRRCGISALRHHALGRFGIPMDRGLPDADVAAETFLT